MHHLKQKILLLVITFLAFQNMGYANITNQEESYIADTAHINKCIELSLALMYIYPDSAQKYIDTAISLSQKINFEYGLYKSNNLQGIIYWMTNNYDEALKHYKLALLYTDYPESERGKAVVLSNIAMLYSHQYQIDSAMIYFNKTIEFSDENHISDIRNKALFDLGNLFISQGNYIGASRNLSKVKEQSEISNDSLSLIYVYSAFGMLYSKLNKFELALLNYNKAIELDEDYYKVDNISNNYINIGELYFSTKKNYDTALYFYKQAVKSALPYNKKSIELAVYIVSGSVFLETNELDSANSYYQKAYTDTLINSLPGSKASLLINIGIYDLKSKDYENARQHLTTGLDMVNELGILVYKMVALKHLSQLDSIEGNFKQSLQYYIDYKIISDSLESTKFDNDVAIMEFEKFMEQEKLKNELLIKENEIKSTMIWITVGVILALLVLLFMLYLNRTRIKFLLEQLSNKHNDLQVLNEELVVTNESLVAHQSKLKELNASKDKFFAILSHDLKSPFNGLLGMLDLIIEDWGSISDSEKKDLIQSLFTSSKKTYNLLEDMLNWSKTQQGQIKYNPEVFTAYPTIIEITKLLKAHLEFKKQHLTIDIPDELQIKSDKLLFTHIIQNLLNNAIKFTHVGGGITIKIEHNEKKTKIYIIDDGIGIPENKISGILNLDSNFNRLGTTGEKSTGMGLLLSNEYAKIINAIIKVKSKELEGSSFCLILPN